MLKATSFVTTAAFALAAATSQAATINWGAPQDLTSKNDIHIAAGGVHSAFNGGDVDDDIEVFLVPGAGPDGTPGDLLFEGYNPFGFAGFGLLTDVATPGTSGDSQFDLVLNQASIGGGTSTTQQVAEDLTPGVTYDIQIFFLDLRNPARDLGLDGQVQLDAIGSGLGQFAIGSFVADASTQSVDFAAINHGNVHLVAGVISAVPEPTTGLLLSSLGGVALLRRNRRA